ncbi:hypothetical protein QBC44DRAFT_381640 [Cladorrhinum sp. PSN332]|nr:hypothetical protein QBC44DRAFT_381640 [Cladorrhinum sp. PSN332]
MFDHISTNLARLRKFKFGIESKIAMAGLFNHHSTHWARSRMFQSGAESKTAIAGLSNLSTHWARLRMFRSGSESFVSAALTEPVTLGYFIAIVVILLALTAFWLSNTNLRLLVGNVARFFKVCCWLFVRVCLGRFLSWTVSPFCEQQFDSILESPDRRLEFISDVAKLTKAVDNIDANITKLQGRLTEIRTLSYKETFNSGTHLEVSPIHVSWFASRKVRTTPNMGKVVGFLLWLNRLTRSLTCLEAVQLLATHAHLVSALVNNAGVLAACQSELDCKEVEYLQLSDKIAHVKHEQWLKKQPVKQHVLQVALNKNEEERRERRLSAQPSYPHYQWPAPPAEVVPIPVRKEPDLWEYPLHREQRLRQEQRQALLCPPEFAGVCIAPVPVAAVAVEPTNFVAAAAGPDSTLAPPAARDMVLYQPVIPATDVEVEMTDASVVPNLAAAPAAQSTGSAPFQFGAVSLPVLAPPPAVNTARAQPDQVMAQPPVAPAPIAALKFDFVGGGDSTGSAQTFTFGGGPTLPAFPSAPAPPVKFFPVPNPSAGSGPGTADGKGKRKATACDVDLPSTATTMFAPASAFLSSCPSAASGGRHKPKVPTSRKRNAGTSSSEIQVAESSKAAASRSSPAAPDPSQPQAVIGLTVQHANVSHSGERLNQVIYQIIRAAASRIKGDNRFPPDFRSQRMFVERCDARLNAALDVDDLQVACTIFDREQAAKLCIDDVFGPYWECNGAQKGLSNATEFFGLLASVAAPMGLILPSRR